MPNIEIQETKVTRPIIRPLDLLKCFHYGCTWLVMAMIFAIIAGFNADRVPTQAGHVVPFVLCGIACVVTCIFRTIDNGDFVP